MDMEECTISLTLMEDWRSDDEISKNNESTSIVYFLCTIQGHCNILYFKKDWSIGHSPYIIYHTTMYYTT